jgi:hypothetical protein
MKRYRTVGTLIAALTFAGSSPLSAQDSAPSRWHTFLIADVETVYDTVNQVTWLRDMNLPRKNTFGLSTCASASPDQNTATKPTEPCVNASGSMNYQSAKAWVKAMNDAHHLGHSNWQLPTTPFTDPSCTAMGPPGNSFGFGCAANSLGFLYRTALGFGAPNTAVPIPPNEVWPIHNFQPNLYW